ncbi:MAG: response regulator [Thermodesulfovibrio sp.]|nr:response regulator [Thermodesulfovibrio sp.]MDW7971906.1 response regulator [Thermodesulfovibrio sp.]
MEKEKILVIDDSPLVRKLAEVALQEADYEVYTAADAEEGLKVAESIKPDLILVDLIMPKITGSQFCKIIRENETLKDTPIILITGKGERVGETFMEKYQVLDYFIKPFKSEDLIEKVKKALSKVPESMPEVLEIEPELEIKDIEEIQPSFEVFEKEELSSFKQKPESLEFLEEKEVSDFIDESQQLTKEIDLEEVQEIEEPKLFSEIEEIKPEEIIFKEEKTQTEPDTIKEEKSIFSLSEVEALIDDKFKEFYGKILDVINISLEGVLKKYGFIKDSSTVLSGDLRFLKLQEIFSLISSNGLNGILTVFGKKDIYEFLFINGRIIYGVSNFQKYKVGFKLLNEIPQDRIKTITIETINAIRESEIEKFVFEIRDFSENWLLNRESFDPSELFKEV